MSFTIQMTTEQLRVIRHALRNCDMTDFVPAPEDDLDADGSVPETMAQMADDVFEHGDSDCLYGWAI